MKKTFLSISILCLAASAGYSQNRTRYAFDNFDASRGIVIVSPSKPEIAPAEKKKAGGPEKKAAKKASQKTMSMMDAVSMKGQTMPIVQTYPNSKISMMSGGSLSGFTTGNPEYDSYIVDSSRRYNIDPMLIYAQMHQESGFKRAATSHKGASGLMQLMPATAVRWGVTDIYDPRQNIDAGVKYMRWLLNKFNGDVRLALAGYNAGEGAVMKYGNQIPPYRETQEYVRRITARYTSIRNPNMLKVAKTITPLQVAKLEKKEAPPLTVMEKSAIAVRLPDGRMRLVNQ